MHQILLYIFAGLVALSTIARIYFIDKPREPIRRHEVIIDLIFNAVFIWVLLS